MRDLARWIARPDFERERSRSVGGHKQAPLLNRDLLVRPGHANMSITSRDRSRRAFRGFVAVEKWRGRRKE
jgi:hypothetical protein